MMVVQGGEETQSLPHLIAQLEANQQQYLSATQIGQVVTARVSDDTQTLTRQRRLLLSSH